MNIWTLFIAISSECFFYTILEIKPCGLGPRIRDVEAKHKLNSFTCAIVFGFMVYPDPIFFLMLETDFLSTLCHHTKHLQHLYFKMKIFCRMNGLAVIVSVATLNICQILMRSRLFYYFLMETQG